MKKAVLILTVLLLVVSLALPAYAQEVVQDDLVISLTADKTEYASNEPVTLTLTVTNRGMEPVRELDLELLIPQGYKLAGEAAALPTVLEAEETATLTLVYQPEVTEPEATEPEVTEPEVTEAEVTEPEVTEPEVTEPEVTEPEVTEPEVTEPEVTEPEATEPEVTEPETEDAPQEEPIPETGDIAIVILLALALAGSAVLIFGGKPMAKRLLCVVLCLSMVGGVVLPARAIEAEKKEAQITLKVTVNGQELDFTAVITYLPDSVYADPDGDGVANYIEELAGSDPNNADTDGDGLSDYDELMYTDTNPTLTDSDGNGVADGDEDADGDGLINLRELELGTALNKVDTDSDGIADGEEVELGTDPLNEDSDGDGVADGQELELGTNPAASEQSFSVTEGNGMASVSLELEGQQVGTLSVKPVENEVLFPETIPGYMGQAYNFTVDGSFDTADISFSFDAAALGENAQPVIYYFNEVTQTLEALETTVENGVATATVEHFSTYILLDRALYDESFTWEDTWDISGSSSSAAVVLVIDDSASMGYMGDNNDPNNERLTVSQNLIDQLPDGSQIGVVSFATKINVLTSSLTTNKTTAKNKLTTSNFTSSGSKTNMYAAINEAMGLLDSVGSDVMKTIIVVTDGYAHDYSSLHSSTVSTAVNNGVKIMTVGLGGEAAYATYLKPLAENTGGTYQLAADATELTEIFRDLNKDIDLNLDTDGDGIPDFYEDNMVAFNGMPLQMDKYKKDTDGDGLTDSQEVEVELVESSDGTQVYVKGVMYSSPMLPDTDFDGTNDASDGSPLSGEMSGVLSTAYATSDVDCEMDYRWFFDSNEVYNPAMSKVSILFASELYEGSTLELSDTSGENYTAGTSITEVMKYMGLKNVSDISLDTIYSDKHLSEVAIGYRTVTYNGVTRNVVAVAVRGTNGTIEEWSSNCDIGDITKDTSSDDWVNTQNHKGFDMAAKRIEKLIASYVSNQGLKASQTVYWVTGHSRGAAIANIIGADFEDAGKTAYTITFAAPNNTLASNAASYRTIFNVINEDDFVPCLPMEAWGYTVYGRSTSTLSIREDFEKEWENTTGIFDYNSDASGMEDCVAKIAAILPDGCDPRVESFRYTCSCHGDGSDDTITITNKGMSESSREGAIAKIPACAQEVCIITRYEGGAISGWDFDVCQTPAYLMQLLAAYMGGEIGEYRFAVELNIADRYEKAKTAIVSAGLSGIAHPHYFESYYVLSNHVTAEDF